MNQQVIDRYQISFTRGLPYNKIVLTNDVYLTDFLNEWNTLEDIDEYLIPGVTKVMDGTETEFEAGAATFDIIVGPVSTVFYIYHPDAGYPEMPTKDFKEILDAWRNYLGPNY